MNNFIVDIKKPIRQNSIARLVAFYKLHGFLVLRGICEKKDITYLRKKLQLIFKEKKSPSADISDFIKERSFFDPIINEKILVILKSLLGEKLRIFPNLTARKNTFSPWHVDEAFTHDSIAGDLDSTDFIQCSLFLQNNSKQFGGGLDVIDGSHKLNDIAQDENKYNLNIHYFLKLKENILTVDSLAGDVIIWDGRLFHKSSPRVKQDNTPKYSLMWTVAKWDSNYQGFLKHLVSRGKKMEQGSDIYDHRYMEISTLKTIPPDIMNLLAENNLSMTLYKGK